MTASKNTARMTMDENGKQIVQLYFCKGREARIENNIRLDDGTVVNTPFDDLDITLDGKVEMLVLSNLCTDAKKPPSIHVHAAKDKEFGARLEDSRFGFIRFDQTPRYLAFSCVATDMVFIPRIPREKTEKDHGLCGMDPSGLFSNSLVAMTTIFTEEKENNVSHLEARIKKMREQNASNSFAVINGRGLNPV